MVGHVRASYWTDPSPYGVQVPMQSHTGFRGLHTTSSARVQDISSAGWAWHGDREVRTQTTYRPSQTVLNMNTSVRTAQSFAVAAFAKGGGHFSTYVPSVSDEGFTRRPHRVSGEEGGDDPEDPYEGNVVPVGDTPWLWLLLMLIGYLAAKVCQKRTKYIEK